MYTLWISAFDLIKRTYEAPLSNKLEREKRLSESPILENPKRPKEQCISLIVFQSFQIIMELRLRKVRGG